MTGKDSLPKPPKRKREFSVRSFKISSIFTPKAGASSSTSSPAASSSTSTEPLPIPRQLPLFKPFNANTASSASFSSPSTQSFVGVSQSGSITRREEKSSSKRGASIHPISAGHTSVTFNPAPAPPPPPPPRDLLPSLLPYESDLYTSVDLEPMEESSQPATASSTEKPSPSVCPCFIS